MKSVILGTAGHVDHGKTALVEALTGVNTDRWEEERARGITIDLGFAPFPSGSDDLEIAVVDVPGHEDFVKNMLAGATGVDVLLLVVAADEGPMPQTREHLWIARLLGVQHGVVAITKSDLVDPEWCDMVAESVGEVLQRVFQTRQWPVIAVSAVTGAGLPQLESAIRQAGRAARARPGDDLFRLPIDRSFSVRGVGTVVTGTVWSGRVATGDEIRVLPGERKARVRGMQVHGRDVDGAHAGQRVALAMVGLERSEARRGHLLVADPAWRETRYLDAWLQLVPDSPWPVDHWQRVHFHLGTAETLARVVLYEGGPLQAADSALVQLRLEEPVVARAGDRFVIRFYSPVTTIGGGVVLDPWASRRSRLSGVQVELLNGVAGEDAAERARCVILDRDGGVSETDLALLTGASPPLLRDKLRNLAAAGSIRDIDARWYPEESLRSARDRLVDILAHEHANDSGARGVSLEALRSALGRPAGLVNAALADLEQSGAIRVEGSVAALVEHVPALSREQQVIAEKAASAIRQSGLAPPAVKQLAAQLELRADDLLPVLKFLAEQGSLVPVTPDLFFDSSAISEAKERVSVVLAGGRAASPSQFREVLEVSRKYLIPLLEYLDSQGFTRRTREGRVLRERR